MAVVLGTSFDVVEVLRSLSQAVGLLTTDQQSLQEFVARATAALEVRVQVLEGKQILQVGDLVAESEAPKPALSASVVRRPTPTEVGR
jgi:hypothetical protein